MNGQSIDFVLQIWLEVFLDSWDPKPTSSDRIRKFHNETKPKRNGTSFWRDHFISSLVGAMFGWNPMELQNTLLNLCLKIQKEGEIEMGKQPVGEMTPTKHTQPRYW